MNTGHVLKPLAQVLEPQALLYKAWLHASYTVSEKYYLSKKRSAHHVQVMVDIRTPKEVFNRVEEVVKAHVQANPLDFSGESSVNANFGGDPLKFSLTVWWSYCYNGARA